MQNSVEDLLLIVCVEGRVAACKFIHQGSETVEVYRKAVTDLLDDFRRHIRRTPAEGSADDLFRDVAFTYSKVNQFDMALCVQQNIFRFEVAVEDILLV